MHKKTRKSYTDGQYAHWHPSQAPCCPRGHKKCHTLKVACRCTVDDCHVFSGHALPVDGVPSTDILMLEGFENEVWWQVICFIEVYNRGIGEDHISLLVIEPASAARDILGGTLLCESERQKERKIEKLDTRHLCNYRQVIEYVERHSQDGMTERNSKESDQRWQQEEQEMDKKSTTERTKSSAKNPHVHRWPS